MFFHGFFFLALSVVLYFLPAIIGSKKHNATAILLVNLFLGWTVVGWIVALVWALSSTPEPGQVVIVQPPAPQAPTPQPAPQAPAPRSVYCSRCGTPLKGGDRFCPSCGGAVPA